jgi:hypothetical protein
MKKPIISPTQRKALEVLEAGGCIHVTYYTGPNMEHSAFIVGPNNKGHETISMATVNALITQGWLKNLEVEGYLWRSSHYVLSRDAPLTTRKLEAFEWLPTE